MISDADIYDPIKRLEYVKYWEDKRQELADKIRTVDPANLQGIRDDIDNYHQLQHSIRFDLYIEGHEYPDARDASGY